MKKNYISPELMTENIAVINVIASSPLSLMTDDADDSPVLTKDRSTVDFSSEDNNFDF